MVEGQRRSFGVSPPEQILSALNQNCNFVYEKKKSLYAISEIENSLYGTRWKVKTLLVNKKKPQTKKKNMWLSPIHTTTKLGKHNASKIALLTLKRYKLKHGGLS